MPRNTEHTTRKSRTVKVFALLLVTICLTTAGAVMLKANPLAWFAPSITQTAELSTPPSTLPSAPPSTPHNTSLQQAQGQAEKEPLQAELITLRPTGFEPARMELVKGRFLLVVNNHSELPDVQLQLMRETGARMHAVRVPSDQVRWSEVVDLHPGTYVLTAVNHPDWVCRITV